MGESIQLETCPYDPSHRIRRYKMPMHLVKCEKNHRASGKVRCPYNAVHIVDPVEYQAHLSTCLDYAIELTKVYKVDTPQQLNVIPIEDVVNKDIVPTEEDWDKEPEAKPYDPLKHSENKLVYRRLSVASKSEKKAFMETEKRRWQALVNENKTPQSNNLQKNKRSGPIVQETRLPAKAEKLSVPRESIEDFRDDESVATSLTDYDMDLIVETIKSDMNIDSMKKLMLNEEVSIPGRIRQSDIAKSFQHLSIADAELVIADNESIASSNTLTDRQSNMSDLITISTYLAKKKAMFEEQINNISSITADPRIHKMLKDAAQAIPNVSDIFSNASQQDVSANGNGRLGTGLDEFFDSYFKTEHVEDNVEQKAFLNPFYDPQNHNSQSNNTCDAPRGFSYSQALSGRSTPAQSLQNNNVPNMNDINFSQNNANNDNSVMSIGRGKKSMSKLY
ncbi:uncharacterized protein LOC107265803 [Cephus cinctus]|uniref:Uncharacterized protein LOC107265803 n=1 Tax=Cephus cinctus TaxID=211228 RepID=A0AAJ7BPK4_CEPCN|nr:uncharacterized protein LOC107265803 [Cephus cinctus]XP_015591121.1 uncharacterized protein LOC107265803 [Cephus cinctus]